MDSLGQKYLDSREVAEMVGKEHNKLLRDIRVYITQLNASKVGHTDFFTESQYTDKSNRQKPCYLVTKKGCEFIAHKLTGVKGTEFTAKYINRFHEMEDTIKTQLPQGNDLIALAVIEAQKMIAERDKQIERMKPKEIFADAVSASKDAILIGDLAKLISQNGYRIGQNRLFDWLRNNGYLIKSGSSRNRPMQRYVEQGLFEVKETAINMPNGNVRTALTTKVSGKGQQYFVNKFLQKRGENDERSAESKL
jgi:Rha family phage regulatory protein|nr:MAG TPA: KilAC domain protein [Bacteriophage sp.]